MFIILTIALLCLIVLFILRYQSLLFVIYAVKYEIVYLFLGFKAVIEDYMYRKCVDEIKEFPLRPGDVAVITGGSRGIGLRVAARLMSCDMHVVIGCRNVKQGSAAVARLKSAGTARGSAECLHVDMASLASVRRFAEEVLERCPRINVLINNAGIMFAPFELTEDGFESHLAVNYLGHCLLTHLLLPRLRSSAVPGVSSRVVNVSSCAHEYATINFQDLNTLNWYLGTVAYGQSKLAQVLFTRALERRLRAAGAPVRALAVHPGVVDTNLFDGTAIKLLLPWLLKLLFKTPEQGAMPVLYAAVGAELEGAGGAYVSNCRVAPCSEAAARETTQEQLWARMMGMLQLETFGGL